METKWTKNEIIQFLNIYKKYDCLWDVLSPDYVNRDARDLAFTHMMEELSVAGVNVSLEYLKRKIKSIRDTYRNEVNRIKKSKKTGARSQDIYKPKLAWFSTADSFWHFNGKESSSNLDIDAQSSCSQDDAKMEEEETQITRITESPDVEAPRSTSLRERPDKRKQMKVVSSPWSSKYQALKRSPRRMPPLTPSKISRIAQRKNSPDRFESAVDKLNDILQFESEDQYDKFGKHIAAQLREMPLRSFVLLQDKIQNLITTERLSYIEPHMSSDYPVSTFFLKDEPQ